jgi:hypothetical protein
MSCVWLWLHGFVWYHQEYIKERETQEAAGDDGRPQEEPPEHHIVRTMMASLFSMLDALSNFHFTPKPVSTLLNKIAHGPERSCLFTLPPVKEFCFRSLQLPLASPRSCSHFYITSCNQAFLSSMIRFFLPTFIEPATSLTLNLKVEAEWSSEVLVLTYYAAKCYNSETVKWNCAIALYRKAYSIFILKHLFCEYPHPYLTHFWAQSRLRLGCSHKVCPVCVYPIFLNVAMLTCLVLPNIVAALYLWGSGLISWFRDLLFWLKIFFCCVSGPGLLGSHWVVGQVDSKTWILSKSR